MSQAERHARQQEAAAKQAAAILQWRQKLGMTRIAHAVRLAFADTYPMQGCYAAHWVSGAVNVCLRRPR